VVYALQSTKSGVKALDMVSDRKDSTILFLKAHSALPRTYSFSPSSKRYTLKLFKTPLPLYKSYTFELPHLLKKASFRLGSGKDA
jgi:hypothetical protein